MVEKKSGPLVEDRIIFSKINSAERFPNFPSSFQSAIIENCKQFRNMPIALLRAEAENKKLAKRNKKLEDFVKAKNPDESRKRYLDQTGNKLDEVCTTFTVEKEERNQVGKQQDHAQGPSRLSKRRKCGLKVYTINECVNCPTCLEDNNVCSVSCGHFFVRSCITQWITSTGAYSSSKCPICSRSASLKDIRDHHVSQMNDNEKI